MTLLALAGFRFLELGDSNSKGTQVDPAWAGQPVPSGYTYLHNGVPSATWPAGSNPAPGKGPYLVDLADDNEGWYIRRGTSGATSSWGAYVAGQWAGALGDVAALGGSPDLVVLDYGANDSRSLAASDAYEGNVSALVDAILAEWPGVDIVLARETTSDRGALSPYTYLRTTIYDALDVIDAAYPQVQVVDATTCRRCDSIHWRYDGQGCVAELVWLAVAP